jgi:sugar (pentulose or hexulose) kinase
MYLGLDLGTTNVKAVVVDHGGRVASIGSAPVKRYHTDDGGIEQDIGQIWQAVQLAIHDAIRQVDSASILAVGVSSQGGAMQILDPGDKPRGRVISWLDARGQPFDAALTAEWGGDFFAQRIGHGSSGGAIGQILRLQSGAAASLKAPAHIGFVGDIIVGRLCGRRAHDPTSLSIAMLYNPWLKRPDPEVMARLGLEDEQLPCMLPATTAAGTIDEATASVIGLPAGIPVSPAVHDQYAASLGAGSVSKGDVSFGAGTAWVLLANAGQLSPPATPNAFVCSHPVEGLYGQMLSLVNGGSAIHWAMNMIGNGHADVQQVDRLLAAAPPGAEGLRFWPFLSIGPEVIGKGRLKGRLSGITLAHGPADMIRAVVEGLACELNRHVRQLAGDCSSINVERNEFRSTFIRIKRLIMCGSAATGGNTPQIIADVTRLPVHCVETPDISALGAAMIGRSLVEPGVKLDEIARQWTPPRRTVTPSEHAAVYENLYEEYLSILAESAEHP